MSLCLSTDHLDPKERAESWHGTITSVLGRTEVVHADPMALRCGITARKAGDLTLLRSQSTPFASQRSERHIRGDDRENLSMGLILRGTVRSEQDDRRICRRPGTIAVADLSRPYTGSHETEHEVLGFSIPRERLERVFGTSKRFTLLTIDQTLGSASIVAFLTSLYDNAEQMVPEAAAEMADVAIELVMSALARRLAMEPAVPQSAALQLHRAKAYIAANLADPELSPVTVAAAIGVSVRHMQALFQRLHTTPSDWIWHKRLACARERLSSPGFAAVSVGEVAYGCGFADPAHFSRRFKAAFGLSPRDWRQRSLLGIEATP